MERRCCFTAAKVDESKGNRKFSLEERVHFLLYATSKQSDFDVHFQRIIDLIPHDVLRHCKQSTIVNESIRKDYSDLLPLTLEKLVKINSETKQCVYQLKREQAKWDALLDQAFFS